MDSTTIIKSLESVTAKWTKQRKQEERGRAQSRRAALTSVSRPVDQVGRFGCHGRGISKGQRPGHATGQRPANLLCGAETDHGNDRQDGA